MPACIPRVEIFAGESPALLGRIVGALATPVTSAEVSSIACTVYREHLPATEARWGSQTHCTAPVPFSVPVIGTIFDSIQTGPDWTADAIGYNFRHHLPAAKLPHAGTVYFVQYALTMSDGFVEQANFEVAVRAVPPEE